MKYAWLVLTVVLGGVSLDTAHAGYGYHRHGHHACPHCAVCCPSCGSQAGPARRDAEPVTREATTQIAPVVQSVPMFAMPTVSFVPTMPMMAAAPQTATRGAERSAVDDCCERVDSLERELKRLAESVAELQGVVAGQTQLLKKLYEERTPPPPAPGGGSPAPASNGGQ